LENDLSTNNITRSNQTTRSANMLSVGEKFWHCRAANACLTGAARVYLYQSAPSIFGFVRNLRDKGSPTSIVNRLGKHTACHAFDIQVFDSNRSEILYQPERETMLELVPLIPDSSVNLREQRDGFAPPIRSFLTPCNFPLRSTSTGFGLPMPSRVWNSRTISESREVFEPQVNSDCIVERRQALGFAFNRDADLPLAALKPRFEPTKFASQFVRREPLEPRRKICASQSRVGLHEYVNVVGHYFRRVNFGVQFLGFLAEKLPESLLDLPDKHRLAIFWAPNKVVLERVKSACADSISGVNQATSVTPNYTHASKVTGGPHSSAR